MTIIPGSGLIHAEAIHNRASAFLDTLSPATRADVEAKIATLKYHEAVGCLSPKMYIGKRVLDWEAGLGGFAAAFFCLGASEVVAIDSWVTKSAISPEILSCDAIEFHQVSIGSFVENRKELGSRFDLVFSNTVTEHISDLPSSFDAIQQILSADGVYMNVHDNYYSPCGSHDHGFWFYGDAGQVVFQGVDCWNRPERCDASAEHRVKLLSAMPWTWNERLEARRDPTACVTCPYFKRGQPWGHLKSVDDFPYDFEDKSFFTLREGSSLNKFTTFQVRQFLVEAGFRVDKFHRNRAMNAVPDDLLECGFSALELTTTTSVWICSKVDASANATAF